MRSVWVVTFLSKSAAIVTEKPFVANVLVVCLLYVNRVFCSDIGALMIPVIERPKNVPDIWRVFTDALKISPSMSREVWRAISRSQYSVVQAVRFEILAAEERPLSMRKFRRLVTSALPPKRFVEVLESLVTQQLLSRRTATLVEQAVWEWTDKTGDWQMVVQLSLDTLIAGNTLPSTKEIVP